MNNDAAAFIGEIQTQQKRKSGKQNRYFKKEAKRTLFAADNFYKAVISHFIAGVLSGGFLFMTFYVPGLTQLFFSDFISENAVNALATALNIILYIIFSFFFFAFFLGVYILAARMRDEPDKEEGRPKYASLSAMLLPLNCLKNARLRKQKNDATQREKSFIRKSEYVKQNQTQAWCSLCLNAQTRRTGTNSR